MRELYQRVISHYPNFCMLYLSSPKLFREKFFDNGEKNV